MSTKSKILIVEDEASIAMDLQSLCEECGYEVVDLAYTYNEAVEALRRFKPDLVMLDIALRGEGNGLDVARHIKTKYSISFIFLTSFSDADTIKEVVDLQPAAYLVKPFKEKDIAPTLALALANTQSQKSTIPSFEYINDKLVVPLSNQEYRVLQLLCQGCSNQELADQLHISINTIKTHVYRLYQKLETKSRSSTISRVLEM